VDVEYRGKRRLPLASERFVRRTGAGVLHQHPVNICLGFFTPCRWRGEISILLLLSLCVFWVRHAWHHAQQRNKCRGNKETHRILTQSISDTLLQID
jgi:hypothetical protein